MAEMLNKKFETIRLERELLPQQKIVVEARLRNPKESLEYLYNNRMVTCTIEPKGDFERVHFVIHYD